MGEIGAAIGLGSELFSGLSGLAQSANSGNSQQFFPPVEQSGGITPFQEDAAQYGYQEHLLADASEFAGSGTGHSTMATQAAGGDRIGKALAEGKMSDVNAGAILSANQIAEGNQAIANQQNAANTNTQVADNAFTSGFNNPPGGTQSNTDLSGKTT